MDNSIFETFTLIAADSVEALRKCDVFRVLDNSRNLEASGGKSCG